MLFSTGGRFYTLQGDKLPSGRGHGEPIRIMVDMENDQDIVGAFPYKAGRKLLVASTVGNGFIVSEDDVVANTRKGKQVLNVKLPDEAKICGIAEGDHIAVVGENRKMIIFKAADLPEMGRGKGVRLQKYKDGGISDARMFNLADGLTWEDSAGRTFTKTADELVEFMGERAQAGRMVPKGFPKNGKFG